MPDLSNAPEGRRRQVVTAGHSGDTDRARAGLDDPDAHTRELSLGALARLRSLRVEDLERAADDDTTVVRRRAAEEGGRLRQGDPRPTLARLLRDRDAAVVEMAAWALGEHPPRAVDVAALADVATAHHELLCREAAVAALGALADRRGLEAVLAGTQDRATVRRRAVLALAPFDGPEVDRAVRAALTDRDWQVRQAAEDLLDAGAAGADPASAG